MHNQVLVILPKNINLKDVMYWYQEIDKTPNEKINDERCQFFLTLPEKEIPNVLIKIKKYSENELDEDILKEYEKIKDLPYDDPHQIKFIKDNCDIATDIPINFYIKGKGYGVLVNPYQIWDYYKIVDERRFPKGTNFLVNTDGSESNHMPLGYLDVESTIENIHNLTMVWNDIIFCKETSSQSEIYTTNTIRFDYEWNKHCLIDNLENILYDLVEKYGSMDYNIVAIDYHW